jgi:hypothetical protein
MKCLMLTTVTLVAFAAGVAPNAAAAEAAGGPQLPDLDQETPGQLQVAASGAGRHRQWWLGFSSAVSNVGDGPFVINGHRPDRRTEAMVADQVVDDGGGGVEAVKGVGRLRFVVSPDHNHWHLIHFDRYELRRAGRKRVIVRDRKSGFCLGDRYALAAPPPNTPEDPVYTSRCGLGNPGLLELTEGISVGYGDLYAPYLEYQQLPLDGLDRGRYVLVHSVNSNGRLRETSLANDSASVLISLRWRHRRPRIELLRTCPDSARCDRPGAGTEAGADRVPVSLDRARAARFSRGFVCSLPRGR